MNPDYQKSKNYKLIKIENNKDVYVGSTCQTLEDRFSEHKRSSIKIQLSFVSGNEQCRI